MKSMLKRKVFSIITISWDTVNEASGYDIEADGVALDNGANTSYTHDGLLSGTQHTYRVKARGPWGEGEWSDVLNAATNTLAVPAGFTTTQSFYSISIEWGAVPEADGYEVEADGVVVSNTAAASYTQNGLQPNTQHAYRVRAVNPGGSSQWSETVTAVTSSFGSGTAEDPYIITTVEELANIKNNLSGHFKLGNDMDLEGEEWTPVGSSSAPFTGSLDGNGYAGGLIGQSSYIAIRYCYSAGTITSNGTSSYKGGLIGYVNTSTTVTSSYYDGISSGYVPQKAEDAGKL